MNTLPHIRSRQARSILLVDDRAEKRGPLRTVLRSDGYIVHSAVDATKAIEHLSTAEKLSVMLMDLSLPNIEDGMNLIREARRICPSLTIIVYTGQNLQYGREAMEAGASFFVESGSTEGLKGIVNAVAAKREIEDELHINKLRGEALQRVFDAAGVELVVRDLEGRITMVNRHKRNAWKRRGQNSVETDYLGSVNCPDGDWKVPGNSSVVSEHRVGEHTLLKQLQPVKDDAGQQIGWVEATWDITRRTKLLEFIRDLEQEGALTTQACAERIIEFLAKLTGGRARFYLREGLCYRGFVSHSMPVGFDIKTFRLTESDAQVDEAFMDHRVKTARVTPNDHCYAGLSLEGATQKLFIPLLRNPPADRMGFVVIDNKLNPDRVFTQEDLDLLGLFRSFIEVAMKTTIRREEEQQERNWLDTLNTIEEGDWMSCEDVSLAYSKVLQVMLQMTGARSVAIKKVTETGSLMTVESIGGPASDQNVEFRPPAGSIANRCITTGEVQARARHLHDDPGLQAYLRSASPELRAYHQGTKALVMLPMKVGEKVVAICVLLFAEERALSKTDVFYGEKLLRFLKRAMDHIKEHKRIRDEAIRMVKVADAGFAAASVAHSMRNNIQCGYNLVSKLRRAGSHIPEIADATEQIDEFLVGIKKRLDTVRDWIVGENAESGPRWLQKDLLQSLITVADDSAKENSVILRTDFQEADFELRQDVVKLRLALLDFVENAIKAMPNGGEAVVGCEAKGANYVVYVADTGSGWPEDVRRDLESDDVDNSTSLGLGLFLARTVVSGMGGRSGPCPRGLVVAVEAGGRRFKWNLA